MRYIITNGRVKKNMQRVIPAYPDASTQTVVRDSWRLLKGREMDLGVQFYERLMRTEPLLRSYFRRDIQEHAHQLVQALTFLIQSLPDSDMLADHLAELGARHQSYGVQPEHYGTVCECLIGTVHQLTVKQWDEVTQEAWITLLRWVSYTMIEGRPRTADR
jgi:hemoglobin-like flavoprotein